MSAIHDGADAVLDSTSVLEGSPLQFLSTSPLLTKIEVDSHTDSDMDSDYSDSVTSDHNILAHSIRHPDVHPSYSAMLEPTGSSAMRQQLEVETREHMDRIIGQDIVQLGQDVSSLDIANSIVTTPPSGTQSSRNVLPSSSSSPAHQLVEHWTILQAASAEAADDRAQQARLELDQQLQSQGTSARSLLANLHSRTAAASNQLQGMQARLASLEATELPGT